MSKRFFKNIAILFFIITGFQNNYAQESQSDIDFLKELQSGFQKGVIHDAIKAMRDSAGINIYPTFHIADDSALWPYALELYFDVRIERKEPYILVTLNLEPSTGKWTNFSKYGISVTLTQGQKKAIPTAVLLAAEKQINEILSNITNLREYFGKIKDNIAETIQKLRFAMMDKYWQGKNLPLVTFFPASDQEFGFDQPMQQEIISKYKNFYRYDTITRVPWKALSTTKPDKVKAYIQIRDTSFKKGNIRFINRNDVKLQPLATLNDTLVFQLTGISKDQEDEITAEYFDNDSTGKERKAPIGQVKTISYEEETNTVHLVPINGAKYVGTESELETYLNKVYKQAVTKWKVVFEKSIDVKNWDIDGDDVLNIETAVFQRYSDEEQLFIDVMEKQSNYDPKAAYLFITDVANNLNARGYMPLSAQYGFIFTKATQTQNNEVYHNTVAHELGHGVYKLQHPWDEYGTPERQTNNLLDYQFGSVLWKPQWDWMHDPGLRLYMFQKAEEGASIYTNYNYLLPNFTPFRFSPKDGENEYNLILIKKEKNGGFPNGTLYGFRIDNVDYKYDSNTNTFIANGSTYTYPNQYEAQYAKNTYRLVVQNQTDQCIYYLPSKNLSDLAKPDLSIASNVKAYNICHEDKLALNEKTGTGEGNTKLQVWNLTQLSDNETLKTLEARLKKIFTGESNNPLTGEKNKLIMGACITTTSNKDRVVIKDGKFLVDNKEENVSGYDIYLVLSYDVASQKIKVENGLFNSAISGKLLNVKIFAESIEWEQKSFIQKFGAALYDVSDMSFEALYDLLDLISNGIEKLKLSESVWNPDAPGYNKWYGKVFSWIIPVASFDSEAFTELKSQYPDLAKWDPSVMLWAFFCGAYDGIISVVQSVPDILKFVISPLSEKGRTELSEKITNFKELEIKEEKNGKEITLCDKTQYWCKGWNVVKTGITDQFKTPSKGAYFVGSVAGPIIVAALGDEFALEGVFAKVGGNILNFLKWCDNFTDPFRALGLSLKLVKTSSGDLVSVIKNATSDVATSLKNGKFKVKVILEKSTLPSLELTQDELALVLRNAQYGMPTEVAGYKILRLEGTPGNIGIANLENISKKIFNKFNKTTEALFERFSKLGLDNDRLDKLIALFPDNLKVDIAQNLASTLEKAKLTDIYKLRKFVDNLTGNDATILREMLNKGNVNVLAKISNLDNALQNALIKDLKGASAELVEALTKNDGALLKSWEILNSAGSKFSKLSPKYLELFAKHSEDVQKLIAKFSDDANGSTLTKFLDDCDDALINALKNNSKLAEAIVGHKSGWVVKNYEDFGEYLDELDIPQGTKEKLLTWTDRSAEINKFGTVTRLGRNLGNNITTALKAKNGRLFNDLAQKLGMSADELSKYDILSEVPLVTNGGFMKADVVLIRKTPDGIEDVIIIENKLSKTTDFTPRQKEGFGAILNGDANMTLKYTKEYLEAGDIIPVSKNKIFKFSDSGTEDISKVTIEQITKIN